MQMQAMKRMVLYGLLSIEVILFAGIYWRGAHGVHMLTKLRYESSIAAEQVALLHQDVEHLKQELAAWETHPFYKERVAREELQMARDGDTIYYIS